MIRTIKRGKRPEGRYILKIMYKYSIILLFVLLASTLGGCASDPTLSKAEREYRDNIDLENYVLCYQVYNERQWTFIHNDHVHSKKGVYGMNKRWAVKQDLLDNNCEWVLGSYWAHY